MMLLDGLNPGVIPMSTVYVGEKIQVNCALNILSFKITEYCFLRGCQIPIFNNWILIFAMLIHSGVFLKTFFFKDSFYLSYFSLKSRAKCVKWNLMFSPPTSLYYFLTHLPFNFVLKSRYSLENELWKKMK